MAEGRRAPPLPYLAVFDAAARHLNFSAAARELGVTQSAVSHQVRWLEADLGVRLFQRLHRGVGLTPEGAVLADAVREGLSTIGTAVEQVRGGKGHHLLTVAADFGFATWWLMPRLGRLRELMPDIDVRLVTAQGQFDMRREPIDIAVSFGNGTWSGCTCTLLFPEAVSPVCSPAFREAKWPGGKPPDLCKDIPLLHLESAGDAPWLSWPDWFRANGLTMPARRHDLAFNTYPLVLQAAIMGQGVALGWHPLVDDLIATGQLVAVAPEPTTTARGYYIRQLERKRPDPKCARFRRWLLNEAGQPGA